MNHLSKKLVALGLAFGLAALAAHPAEARAETNDALVVKPTVDVPLTLGAGALFLTLFLTPHRQGVILDQTVGPKKGLDSLGVLKLNEGVAHVSDYLLFGGIAAGLGLVAYDGARHGRFGTRTLLYVEAMMMVGVATEITKWAVRRARPYTLDPDGDGRLGEQDDDLSFFSGHTSSTAGWTFAAVRILDLSHDWPAWMRGVGYGGAVLLTASMATMRVMAGKHWPTDVLVGAFVGGALGWVVPELHRKELPVSLAVAPVPGGAHLAVSATF
ncbi:MAG: phosphatase PAP2 family protein [Deltaproteobacteria bacterium]|nr:phosphatase PAP2 family protein [Deltaproteobacteria bacterium]